MVIWLLKKYPMFLEHGEKNHMWYVTPGIKNHQPVRMWKVEKNSIHKEMRDDVIICTGLVQWSRVMISRRDCDHDYHSERGSKNPKPEFSRIIDGGSTSAMSTCCRDLEMSSTVNGMLHWYMKCRYKNQEWWMKTMGSSTLPHEDKRRRNKLPWIII